LFYYYKKKKTITGNFHTSVAIWNSRHISTGMGRSCHFIGHDNLLDILQVSRSEKKPDISFRMWEQVFKLGRVGKDGVKSMLDQGVLPIRTTPLP
jgi:hypothetical protein